MYIKNTSAKFGIVSILLHWIMALLLIALVMMGLYMTSLPNNLFKLKLYGWHKEFGFLALILVSFRIIWRLINRLPSYSSLNGFERFAAKTVHWFFYVLMFAIPITGLMITSAADLGVSFFGLFIIPPLISPDEVTMERFESYHLWLSYGLIAAILLHIFAAFKHHFINKDDILKRML